MARLADIDANRIDRQNRRRFNRKLQTENFLKSLHMLQANNYLRDSEDGSEAFEDYSIFMYRQNAPEFTDRVKELEKKLLYPVRICWSDSLVATNLFAVVHATNPLLFSNFRLIQPPSYAVMTFELLNFINCPITCVML